MRLTFLSLVLVICGTAAGLEAAPSGSQSTHRVRKGETAAAIARVHGLNLKQLASLNPKANLKRLSVGQRLAVILPARSGRPRPEGTDAPVEPQPTVETIQAQVVALPSLPGTPGLGPTTLVHLERVMPAATKLANPLSETGSVQPDAKALSGSLLALQLQPVLPPLVDPAPTLSDAVGFEPMDPAHLDLLWPVETRTVSSAWGPRIRTKVVKLKPKKSQLRKRIRVRYQGTHKGIDLNAPLGSDVFAAADGRVVQVSRSKGFGNLVILDHGNGVTTVYAHNRANYVREGDIVRRGQKIAEVGRTGNATGCHVHFELRVDGQPRNPLACLNDLEEIPEELVALNTLVGRGASRH